jgi:hypothetical protein
MWNLPVHGNHIIQYQTGDGFRTCLPNLLTTDHLYIGPKRMVDTQFKGRSVRCMTIHRAMKQFEQGELTERCVVLDIRLPRLSSKAYRVLTQLCKDKHLIVLHPPLSDVESMNCLMTLLAVSKCQGRVNVNKWSQYMYNNRFGK